MEIIKEFLIYRVLFPNGKCYIGLTSYPLKERRRRHFSRTRVGSNTIFHNALRKNESNNVKWTIIDQVNVLEKAQELEKYYIKSFDSFFKNNGYNMTLGGEGSLGHIPTEEHKRKISESNKGRIKSLEERENISKGLKGKIRTKEHSDNISRAKTGKPNLKLRGILKSAAHKLNIAISKGSKPFEVFCKQTGAYIGTWISKNDCARDLSLTRTNLKSCLNNPKRNKSHKGYVFKYGNKTLKYGNKELK